MHDERKVFQFPGKLFLGPNNVGGWVKTLFGVRATGRGEKPRMG